MRTTATALWTAMALCGAATSAPAQDKPKETDSEAAEDAFLKAYFSEKELKDYAAAEKAYAALLATNPESREVVARALLGRARSLRELKRGAEADAAFARVLQEFADMPTVVEEARAAKRATAERPGGIEGLVRAAIAMNDWANQAPLYGDRGVPVLAKMLHDDQPDVVGRAAVSLGKIRTPAAVEALTQCLAAGDSTYPAQVEDAVTWLPTDALERLSRSARGNLRVTALSELVYSRELKSDAPLELIAGDAELRASFLSPEGTRDGSGFGRLLGVALAQGGDARAAALARIREAFRVRERNWRAATDALLDPPEPVLRDAEALLAIADLRSVQLQAGPPSDAFVAGCLALPQTEKLGVDGAFANAPEGFRPADPDRFLDVMARTGFFPRGLNSAAEFPRRLLLLLGDHPPPERLRRLAAAWPAGSKAWFMPFVGALLSSGVTDEASLTAVHGGVTAPGLRVEFLSALADHSPGTTGAWAVKLFGAEIENPDPAVRQAALLAMRLWQRELHVDLAPFAPAVVRALDSDDEKTHDAAKEILKEVGRAAVRPLTQALAGPGSKVAHLDLLRELDDASAADDVERVLKTTQDRDTFDEAGKTLAALRGDAAKDALVAAVGRDGGGWAAYVLMHATGARRADDEFALSPATRLAVFRAALATAAGDARFIDDHEFAWLPVEAQREVARLALRSKSSSDRAWGAERELTLLDAGAWDELLAVAQDDAAERRDAGRAALRAIRAKEREMAEFRSMSDERATRARIGKLIASEKEDDKRAGIAAIVATGLPGMVDDLIRLAAEDVCPAVREDARRALVALARTPAAPQPAATPEDKK